MAENTTPPKMKIAPAKIAGPKVEGPRADTAAYLAQNAFQVAGGGFEGVGIYGEGSA